jgi:acyl dehydratase
MTTAGVRASSPIIELDAVPSLGRLYAGSFRRAATAAAFGRLRSGATTRELPSTTIVVPGVLPDVDRLTAYQHLIDSTSGDVLPAGFVHVQAFPLAIALMNLDGFPFPAAGLIHIGNRIEQPRALTLGTPLDMRANTANLRRHAKGMQFEVLTEVAPAGCHFDPATTWRETSTYLARGVAVVPEPVEPEPGADVLDSSERVRLPSATEPDDLGDKQDHADGRLPPYPTAMWRLAADTGRRYAEVSGDVNPIHLTGLTAKPFGFKRAIAHGMYTAARALSSMPGHHEARFVWEVTFGSPVYLPSTVAFASQSGEGPARGVVWSPRHGRVHLRCSLKAG